MFKNYLKTAFRNFRRHKSSFLINVLGLSIGLACSILILLWVQDELAHDRFLKDSDNIYSVMENQHYANGTIFTFDSTPGILSKALAGEIPEIDRAVTTTWQMDKLFRYDDKSFKEKGMYAGEDFFQIFSFPLLQGQKSQVLANPNSAVISESLARKYFGAKNPIGKGIRIEEDKMYTVTGIFRDITDQSSLQFDYVLPFQDWLKKHEWATRWGNNGPKTFVTLTKKANPDAVSAKIKDFIKQRNEDSNVDLFLFSFPNSFLYGHFENGQSVGGRIGYVRLFSLVAFFILLIACINFMNLSTARSTKRAREVGIRKSIGASRGSLIGQYIGESLIISFFALLISLLMVEAVLPFFDDLTQKSIAIDYSNPLMMGLFLGVTALTGLIAGSYPALYLSSFEAVKVLKGTMKSSSGEVFARKGLVVFQFTLSIILIIVTLIIYNQIQFIQQSNLGYNMENLLYFPIDGQLAEKWDSFEGELKQNPDVIDVSRTSHTFLGRNSNTGDVNWPDKKTDETILFEMVHSDYKLLRTMGMKLEAGRTFSREFGADTTKIVINRAAADVMEMKKPVGKVIKFWDKEWEIIGVAKNFHYQKMQYKIEPLIFMLDPENTWLGFVRIAPNHVQQTINSMQTTFKKFDPVYPFDYRFLDQQYDKMYRSEIRVGTLSRYFAFLAILISCLGLFGLSAFTAEQRTKELGVRKVLGATVTNLAMLLTKDFTKLVIIAVTLAIPIAWWLMSDWLDDYAYHAAINYWIFAFAGLGALSIAWLTVSWQSIKAAWMDPTRSLKSE